LIQSILRELPLCEGSISVRGTVSYASQEPWLFNGSIQQNILFGSPMDHSRYNEVQFLKIKKIAFIQNHKFHVNYVLGYKSLCVEN